MKSVSLPSSLKIPFITGCGALLAAVCISTGSLSNVVQAQQASTAASADSAKEVSKHALPETDEGLPGSGPIRRYDWFQKLWQKRRTEFAAEADQKQNAIVFLGDSITQGLGNDFRKQFSDLLLANRGISGDTTRGMLIRMQDDVLSLNPSAVVLLMGTNDLEENATPEVIAANL
ncbi:MAG: hypothetical protein KDA81_22150, partial [Planctomycetaceae bacterium]|nr:hypothetical protein [Planctomycetaceae bacterium]